MAPMPAVVETLPKDSEQLNPPVATTQFNLNATAFVPKKKNIPEPPPPPNKLIEYREVDPEISAVMDQMYRHFFQRVYQR